MNVVEQLDLESITSHFHNCNFSKTGNQVIIDFVDKKLDFENCLLTKCGYPNAEIYMHYDFYTQGQMRNHCLYEIQNSDWLEALKNMNKVHHRHKDELFSKDRHFIILFEDEVFECIADSFKIIQ